MPLLLLLGLICIVCGLLVAGLHLLVLIGIILLIAAAVVFILPLGGNGNYWNWRR